MSCFINRGGQEFGPYSWDEVNRYVTGGNILMTDLARTEHNPQWTPLSQLLAGIVVAQPKSPAVMVPTPAVMVPTPPIVIVAPTIGIPDRAQRLSIAPPAMHWLLLLLLSFLTSGFFAFIWLFVQSAWVRKIDSQNKSTLCFVFSIVSEAASFVLFVAALLSLQLGGVAGSFYLLGSACTLAAWALAVAGMFGIKNSMERYYTTVEPIGLRMSAFLTFFFNIYYVQYHFTRIADWKRTGVLAG